MKIPNNGEISSFFPTKNNPCSKVLSNKVQDNLWFYFQVDSKQLSLDVLNAV